MSRIMPLPMPILDMRRDKNHPRDGSIRSVADGDLERETDAGLPLGVVSPAAVCALLLVGVVARESMPAE